MRTSTLRIPLVLCLLAMSCLAHADEKEVRSVLTANYARFAAAYHKQDIEAMSNFLTQDYTATQFNGQKLSRAATIAAIRQQCASMTSATMAHKIDKLTVKGSEAIVIIHARTSGTISDPQGRHHMLVAVGVSKDTWAKTGSGWKIKSEVTQKATVTMDGKPLDVGGKGK